MSPETEELLQQWIRKNLGRRASAFTVFKDGVSLVGGLLGLPVAVVAVVALLNQKEVTQQAQADTKQAQAEVVEAKQSEMNADAEAETAVDKLAKVDQPVDPVSPPQDEDSEIVDRLVSDLFSHSGSTRLNAYKKLTNDYRAKEYAVERILEVGRVELAKPVVDQDFTGIYHTMVTLTDMSRSVIQNPATRKQAILDYAAKAEAAFPKLSRRVEILKNWLNTKR